MSSSLSSEEMAYVRVICQYNEEVLQGGIRPNLAESLTNAASSMGDQVSKIFFFFFLCAVHSQYNQILIKQCSY